MSHIHINGWPSFQAWVEDGCPGAKSFNADGTEKRPTTRLAKCRKCERSMVADGLCLGHYRLARSA